MRHDAPLRDARAGGDPDDGRAGALTPTVTDEAGATRRRAYELRLSRLDDRQLRDGVVRWAARRLPTVEPGALAGGLGGGGFVTRVELGDAEAPGLLRELYALGLPPVAVALVPVLSRPADREAARRIAVFAAAGGRFVLTWNWRAFCFGPLWYLKRGLYAKGLVLLGLTLFPLGTLAVTLTVSLAALVYCGLAGNWDDYLWQVKRRQWW